MAKRQTQFETVGGASMTSNDDSRNATAQAKAAFAARLDGQPDRTTQSPLKPNTVETWAVPTNPAKRIG
jgi:hypothetical protein